MSERLRVVTYLIAVVSVVGGGRRSLSRSICLATAHTTSDDVIVIRPLARHIGGKLELICFADRAPDGHLGALQLTVSSRPGVAAGLARYQKPISLVLSYQSTQSYTCRTKQRPVAGI